MEPKDVVIEPDGPSVSSKDDDDSKCTSPGECNDEETKIGMDLSQEELLENYKVRLRKELVSRDGHSEIEKDTTRFLTFKDKNLETAYSVYREPFSSVPLTASLLVQIVGIFYSLFVLPRTCLHFTLVLPPTLVIAAIVFISIAESFPSTLPAFVTIASKKFNDCVWLRRSTTVLTIMLIGISNASDMFASSLKSNADTVNLISLTNNSNASTNLISIMNNTRENETSALLTTAISFSQLPSTQCLFPSYFSHFATLILIAISVVTQLSHLTKILLMIIVTVVYCVINVFLLEEAFKYEIYDTWNPGVPLRFILSAMLIGVTVALSVLSRHMDKVDRVIFMWKNEVSDQKEKASDMRRRNEALVYNILPKHVAEHFMGNRKRSHDELYSQSYAEVGVLFASMPNFSDFYSEESVNNQGLECLRFLNEVISDFDALLELPQFQNIIKIKTIGSTYMAASGLNPSQISKLDDPITVKWAHLSLLVEFALELKKALQGINEQSFNHFVLKMGINHGPITAGVIGARKPHYDIWGNTVNVASRMESTGKAGAIQVTEETCQILQMYNYTFEQRGLVVVKGKGQLMTYYLQGKSAKVTSSPVPTMQTVHEVEEPQPVPITAPPESPNPLTLSSATASPSSVRLNQNYHPNTDNENDNLESLGSNCEENINDIKNANGNIKHSENDPLLTDSPKSVSTNHSSNHFKTDEKESLLENGT